MTLPELRAQFEKGLTRLFETIASDVVYVLLKDQEGFYHFHRYHEISKNKWGLSFDVQRRDSEYTMKEIIRILT